MENFEEILRKDLHQFLLSMKEVDDRLPECPDVEDKWEEIAKAYIPDGIREFQDYPSASLGWMMYIGMAVAKFWDAEWEIYSKIDDLYAYMRDKRGYDSMDEYIREDVLKANHVEFKEVNNLDEAMPELDILYMTRVQRERFFNEEDYVRLKDCYILDKKKMKLAKPDMFVLHPLPRVNEISTEVDSDPRAAYFKQVQYGVYVRMALIMTLLEVEKPC